MKFNEILLEYDRGKTLAAFADRLIQRCLDDDTIYGDGTEQLVNAMMAYQDGINERYHAELYGKDVAPADEKTLAMRRVIALQALTHIEPHDPSPNKEYMRWLVQRYCDGGIRFWEDFGKANEWLATLHDLKRSGYFKRHPEHAQKADVGRFKTLSELGDFIMSLGDDAAKSNAARERELEAQMIESGAVQIVADTPTIKIVVPKTIEASRLFGRNTQWCTAARNDSYQFTQYSKQGPLYIILDKKTNRRWQFHFETHQFMDERDQYFYDWESFPEEAFQYFDYDAIPEHARWWMLTTHGQFPLGVMKRLIKTAKMSTLGMALTTPRTDNPVYALILKEVRQRPQSNVSDDLIFNGKIEGKVSSSDTLAGFIAELHRRGEKHNKTATTFDSTLRHINDVTEEDNYMLASSLYARIVGLHIFDSGTNVVHVVVTKRPSKWESYGFTYEVHHPNVIKTIKFDSSQIMSLSQGGEDAMKNMSYIIGGPDPEFAQAIGRFLAAKHLGYDFETN